MTNNGIMAQKTSTCTHINDIFSDINKQKGDNSNYISILKHEYFRKELQGSNKEIAGVEIDLKNISNNLIGYTLLELTFYDVDGNTLDTNRHKVSELDPGNSRILRYNYSGNEADKIAKYQVNVIETLILPDPIAIGNDMVSIMSHEISEMKEDERKVVHPYGAKLAIRNISDKKIAAAFFEAVFIDIEGNIVDTVNHKTTDLDAGVSRAINIYSKILEETRVKSYYIKVARVVTADVEKVQICSCRAKATRDGEEISVIIKNLSERPIGAVVLVNFFNHADEKIGAKSIVLDSINANEIKHCRFLFKPQPGDTVVRFDPNIAEIADRVTLSNTKDLICERC
jgi:hypothetical protein